MSWSSSCNIAMPTSRWVGRGHSPSRSITMSPAFPRMMHISLRLRDDADFNQFIADLEAESGRRGMTNVRANRVVTVANEAERRAACSTPIPTRITEGKSDGWRLIYCTGSGRRATRVRAGTWVRSSRPSTARSRRGASWCHRRVERSISRARFRSCCGIARHPLPPGCATGSARRERDYLPQDQDGRRSAMPCKFLSRLMLATLVAAALPVPGVIARDADGVRYADIPADAYAVVAQVRAKPGKEDALRAITLSARGAGTRRAEQPALLPPGEPRHPRAFHLHRDFFRQPCRFRGA